MKWALPPKHKLFGLDDNSIETDSYIASDILGVADVWKDYNITGTNITIGIVDSGVDFGASDLQDSAVILSDGYTANFDPTGMGIVLTSLSMAPVTLAGGTFLLLEDREVTGQTLFKYTFLDQAFSIAT